MRLLVLDIHYCYDRYYLAASDDTKLAILKLIVSIHGSLTDKQYPDLPKNLKYEYLKNRINDNYSLNSIKQKFDALRFGLYK